VHCNCGFISYIRWLSSHFWICQVIVTAPRPSAPTPTSGGNTCDMNPACGTGKRSARQDEEAMERQLGQAFDIADLGILNMCSNDPRLTDSSRTTVSTDDDLIRKAAANQILTASFPNMVNTQTGKRNKLRVQIKWTDGGEESFEHTTVAGWVSKGITKMGDGRAGSGCSASG
jgi:hypothetical protein